MSSALLCSKVDSSNSLLKTTEEKKNVLEAELESHKKNALDQAEELKRVVSERENLQKDLAETFLKLNGLEEERNTAKKLVEETSSQVSFHFCLRGIELSAGDLKISRESC